jgi:hypothetical protein
VSARHAGHGATSSDPLGLFLSWLWALGTAAGLVCVAAAAESDLGDQRAAGPTLTTPDAGTTAA